MKGMMFSNPMLKEIEAGRKLVTRRLLNPQPPKGYKVHSALKSPTVVFGYNKEGIADFDIKPRYKSGEIIYIKETYELRPLSLATKLGIYVAPYTAFVAYKATEPNFPAVKWANKMFMPASFARNYLVIENVRPEKLWQITDKEAELEGCPGWYEPRAPWQGGETDGRMPAEQFAELWNEVHGKDAWERDKDKWVWRYEFRPILTSLVRKFI